MEIPNQLLPWAAYGLQWVVFIFGAIYAWRYGKGKVEELGAALKQRDAQIDSLRDQNTLLANFTPSRLMQELQTLKEYADGKDAEVDELSRRLAQASDAAEAVVGNGQADSADSTDRDKGAQRLAVAFVHTGILTLAQKKLSDLLAMQSLYQAIHPRIDKTRGAPNPRDLFGKMFSAKSELDQIQGEVGNLLQTPAVSGDLSAFEEPQVLADVSAVAKKFNLMEKELMTVYQTFVGPVVRDASEMLGEGGDR